MEPLGGRLLPAAAPEGRSPQLRGAGAGLQMATSDLAVLDRPQTLQRANIRGRFGTKWKPPRGIVRVRGRRQKPLEKLNEKNLNFPLSDYLRGELCRSPGAAGGSRLSV